jgi:hypothetical protein
MLQHTQLFISKLQMSAIIITAAAVGWAGGNFTSGLPLWNMLLHCMPILLLAIIGAQMLRVRGTHQDGETRARGAEMGMTVLIVVLIIGSTVLVILGVTNPDPNSVGVHSLGDWFSTILMYLGTLLWLATLIPARRSRAATSATTPA